MKWPCSRWVEPSRRKTPGDDGNTLCDKSKIVSQWFYELPIIPADEIRLFNQQCAVPECMDLFQICYI